MKRWLAAAGGLTAGTLAASIVAALLLDAVVHRPPVGGGSITTLLPGYAYGTAAIMKVCIVAGFIMAVVALLPNRQPPPSWAMVSVAFTPLAPLIGAVAVLLAQRVIGGAAGPAPADFTVISRWGVIAEMGVVGSGALAAALSLLRRESPRSVAMMGLIINVLLLALFVYFRFYALGFDQNLWAPSRAV